MKIKFSLKHATKQLVKSLTGGELVNDQIYIDTGLIDAMALIVDNTVKWSWCGGYIQEHSYSKTHEMFKSQRFALFPKGSTIIFTQDKI